MRVGAHLARVRELDFPVVALNALTDLVVGQVAVLFGAVALGSRAVGWAAYFVSVGVDQGIGSAVSGDSQHQLVSGGSGLDVELDGSVDVEVGAEVEVGDVIGPEQR